jgi:hypothetical protein
MPDPRDLTTLANLKAWLNVTSTADDALLQTLVTAASVFIESWLDRPILQGVVTEIRDGTDGDVLVLAVTPVTAVASLTIDGVDVPPAPDATSPGYAFTTTRLSLLGRRFRRGRGNVQVTYSAGYATVPPDLAQAAIALAGLRYRDRDRIGLAAKGLAGETTSFSPADMPADVATVLQLYRKVVPL